MALKGTVAHGLMCHAAAELHIRGAPRGRGWSWRAALHGARCAPCHGIQVQGLDVRTSGALMSLCSSNMCNGTQRALLLSCKRPCELPVFVGHRELLLELLSASNRFKIKVRFRYRGAWGAAQQQERACA